MRRGFKKEAQELAADLRNEIGVAEHDPLDPWALAAHLEIPTWPLTSFADSAPEAARLLLGEAQTSFSGVLVFVGPQCVVVYNDAHALTRQRATVCHEIAHAVLLHTPHRAGSAAVFDRMQEDEARWLGGALLVLDDFCVYCARQGVSIDDAAAHLGISVALMRWRMNMSGAQRRVARAAARMG